MRTLEHKADTTSKALHISTYPAETTRYTMELNDVLKKIYDHISDKSEDQDVVTKVMDKYNKLAVGHLKAGHDVHNYFGSDDMLEKIKGGWTDIDVIIATPDMMPELGKLGRILGPRGLMPNPKTGTVTNDINKAVTEVKSGKIEYRADKDGIVHVGVAKLSFESNQIKENIDTFVSKILKIRPSSVKGTYMKRITLSSTMSPGIRLSNDQFTK